MYAGTDLEVDPLDIELDLDGFCDPFNDASLVSSEESFDASMLGGEESFNVSVVGGEESVTMKDVSVLDGEECVMMNDASVVGGEETLNVSPSPPFPHFSPRISRSHGDRCASSSDSQFGSDARSRSQSHMRCRIEDN